MSNADRIEELRNKYEENPRRYFAPLANEFRKAGDLAQAIAICREHLPKQPGHMSGYIVFGQTLFEANNLDEARTVFEQALTLDPENLIALKHLGDIARMNGENGVARRWYARVLDADPRNDDIASQLASLGAPTPAVAMPVVPPPPAYSEPPLNDAVGVFATFDPSALLDVPDDVVGIAGAREFWTPAETAPATFHEPLDLDFPDSPEPEPDAEADVEAEAAFEEGLMAPEWPDTTDLVARIVTPLRSVTPVSTPIAPEAVEAFGREISDELVAAPLDSAPPDELVDAFLPPEVVARAEVATDVGSEPVALDALPIAMDAELVEFAPAEFGTVSFENVSEPLSEETSEQVSEYVSIADASDEAHHTHDLQDTHELQGEHVLLETDELNESHELHGDSGFSEPLSVATFEPVVENDATDEFADEFTRDFADAESHSVDAAVVTSEASRPLEAESDANADADADAAAQGAADSLPPVHEWSEPESVPTNEVAAETFASDPSWIAQADAESTAIELGDTAEFEIPARPESGAFAAVEPTSLPEPVASESNVAPTDELTTETSAEESFAEISSELQSERDATDRDSETLNAIEQEATSVQANSEVAAFVQVDAVPLENEKAQPFVTETMAELLVSQGFSARAIEVYDELVRRRPHDPVLVARLAELQKLVQQESVRADSVASAPTPRFTTPIRNTPLRNTPFSNTPLHNTPLHNTPLYNTPLYNTPLSNTPLYNTPISATPILVPALGDSVSTQSNLSERHANDRLQAFRTARERFAELSRRRVARRTPTHATAVAEDATDGLSSLFGTSAPATTDELAARALADAFGPVQDSGESLFDPAPSPVPAMPLRSLTPRSNSIQLPPAVESRSDRQPSADYSFDKFFPDPAMAVREAPSSPTTATSTPSSAHPVNEDLAQFSAWLKGLNNA